MPVMSTNDGEKEEGVEVQAEFTRALGIEILGMVDGESVLEVELGPIHMSRANRAHGGLLFTLLDTALGRAVLDALPAGRGCATVELKINYFRPVQSGRVRAVGRLLELTKSLGYAEGEVMNDAGKVLARASGTFFLTRTMRQEERERI
jgi:acyl-CoA thioesterase